MLIRAPFSRNLMITISALLLLVAPTAPAYAHATVIESSPRDGARLSATPPRIVLQFNARIEKSMSRMSLERVEGKNIPLVPLSPLQGKGEDDRLVILLPPLAPGSYLLRYKILSTDGHATPGILRFTVTGGP